MEKTKIKKLGNVELLNNKTTFIGYARTYRIEIIDERDVIVQLKASKISVVELSKDLLIELKGFKYQITLCVLLSKVKTRDLIEHSPVYFNSLTKSVVGDKFKLTQCFNEII